MEKATLKTTLENLVKNTTIEVNFVGGYGGGTPGAAKDTPRNLSASGTFKVADTKRGRGKSGSQLAQLMSLATGDLIEIGTPHNDEVLNIVLPNGTLVGTTDDHAANKSYPKDLAASAALKATLLPLVDCNGREDILLRISSVVPEFNGTFEFVGAKVNVGRFGQISVNLRNQTTSEEWTLWSYNHAAVIQQVTYLNKNKPIVDPS